MFCVLLCVGLYIGSSLDKETLLIECVENSDGTDTDCRECYIKVYGQAPSDEECLQRHY